MSSLIGPGHTSDFLGRSEREFENQKGGGGGEGSICLARHAEAQRLAIRFTKQTVQFSNRRERNASKLLQLCAGGEGS
jgi:hypothetical protein